MKIYVSILSLGALLVLGGCSGKVASHDQATAGITESAQAKALSNREFSEADLGKLVDDGWVQNFGDARLVALVDEAQKNNFALQASAARVDSAAALAKQAGAALKPTVGIGAGYYDALSEGRDEVAGGGLGISWEIDVWGKIRTGVIAEEESFAAVQADYQFARQSLAAATSNAWFLAVESKVLKNDADEVVDILGKTLKIVETKEKVGKGSMKDVFLARANASKGKEAARGADSAYNAARRSLEVLLGRYPGAEIETVDKLTAVPPPIGVGLPSQLLERRPDLIAAESRVAAAFYREKEAEMLKLPSFKFDVQIGMSEAEDFVSRIIAGAFAPLYTGGAIEAEVEKASAAQKEAIANYGQKVLNALNEVEASLSQERDLLEREEYMKSVVADNLKAYQATQKQYEVGKIDFLDVNIAESRWIEARIALVDLSTQRLLNRVQLHLALGGSFEETAVIEIPPEEQPPSETP